MNEPHQDIASAAATSSAPHVSYTQQKRRLIRWLIGSCVVLGVITCFIPEVPRLQGLVCVVPWLVLGLSWCFADAAERGIRIGQWTRVLLVLFFALGLVLYLFQTRGVAAVRSLAWVAVLVVVMFGTIVLSSVTTMLLGASMGLWEIPYESHDSW